MWPYTGAIVVELLRKANVDKNLYSKTIAKSITRRNVYLPYGLL